MFLSRPVARAASYGISWSFFGQKDASDDKADQKAKDGKLPEDTHLNESRKDTETDSETTNQQYSYASAAWTGVAAVGRIASSAASASWNYCTDIRYLQYLKLKNLLNILQKTKNVSVEYGAYLFDILKKTFFSSLADSRIRFLVLQSLELLLGFPVGTTLFIEKGVIPFLESAINAVYEAQDADSAVVLLRIVYKFKEHAPQLVASAVPLFLLLPDKLDFENLKVVLNFAQHMTKFLQPNDWKTILCWCAPFIGYDSVKSFAKLLGINEKQLAFDFSNINNESLAAQSERKDTIVSLLRLLILMSLMQGRKDINAEVQKSKL